MLQLYMVSLGKNELDLMLFGLLSQTSWWVKKINPYLQQRQEISNKWKYFFSYLGCDIFSCYLNFMCYYETTAYISLLISLDRRIVLLSTKFEYTYEVWIIENVKSNVEWELNLNRIFSKLTPWNMVERVCPKRITSWNGLTSPWKKSGW